MPSQTAVHTAVRAQHGCALASALQALQLDGVTAVRLSIMHNMRRVLAAVLVDVRMLHTLFSSHSLPKV
jgi:hypothetical protein